MTESPAPDWPSIAAADAERFDLETGAEADPDLRAFWESGPLLLQEMSSRLDWRPRPSETVIEVGCGTGRLTRALAGSAGRVLAFDTPEWIAAARARNPGLENVTWGTDLDAVQVAIDDPVDGFVAYSALLRADAAAAFSLIESLSRLLMAGGWGVLQARDVSRPAPGSAVLGSALTRLSQALIGRRALGARDRAPGGELDLGQIEQQAESRGLRRERAIGERSSHCLVLFRKER